MSVQSHMCFLQLACLVNDIKTVFLNRCLIERKREKTRPQFISLGLRPLERGEHYHFQHSYIVHGQNKQSNTVNQAVIELLIF